MIAILFLAAYVLLSGGQTVLNKVYQTNVKMSAVSYSLYLIVMGTVAALCFFLMSGCDISGNAMTVIIGCIAGTIVIINMLVMLLCMSKVNLAFMTVAQNAGLLIIPTLYGMIFLGESLTPIRIVGIALIIAAFLVSFVGDLKKGSADGEKKTGKLGYIICILLFFTAGAGNVVHKAYTVSSATGSNEAYLCWINIFLVPVIIVFLLCCRIKSGKSFGQLTAGINFKYYIFVCIGSAIGCLGMVCSMQAMTRMPVSLYSPLYSSMLIIFLTLCSKFYFKENVTKANYISVGLAILSAVASAM